VKHLGVEREDNIPNFDDFKKILPDLKLIEDKLVFTPPENIPERALK